MPITYNSTDHRIEVTYEEGDTKGDSFVNPYTMEDIYQEDVANSWGYVQKLENYYYFSGGVGLLADGADTYFVIDNESIEFTDVGVNVFVNFLCNLNINRSRL